MCTRVCNYMCIYSIYLLYSEWGAYFLSSEYYGSLSQDFRQLEGVQAQQLTDITDHWKHTQSCVILVLSISVLFLFSDFT